MAEECRRKRIFGRYWEKEAYQTPRLMRSLGKRENIRNRVKIWTSLHRRFANFGEFFVKGILLLLQDSRLHKIEIKKPFQNLKQPLCLAGFNVEDLTRVSTFQGMRGKVADIANGIDRLCQVNWQFAGSENLIDLLAQVRGFDLGFSSQEGLECPAAKSGARLRTVREDGTSLGIIGGIQ